jgi:hypothetical protein
MIKKIVAIYPGRFQPMGQHHVKAFKWLQSQFGADTYIATSDVVNLPKSPFNFKEKADIIRHYGISKNLVQVKNPYKAEEILGKFDPATTAVVFMVGAKDMQDDPRFAMKPKKDGSPSYFQDYKKNEKNLQGFDKHGYLIVAPHVSLNVPGYGEMSGTSMRKALGAKIPRPQKVNLFKSIFGWFDQKDANMVFDKLEALDESKLSIAEAMKKKNDMKLKTESTKLFSKDWWNESLELNEAISIDEIKQKFKKFISAIKQESKETKVAFAMLAKSALGKKDLTDAEKEQIGEQMKDVLKTIGLTAIAVLPGGIIAGILIKVLKAESYITPSAFAEQSESEKNAINENAAVMAAMAAATGTLIAKNKGQFNNDDWSFNPIGWFKDFLKDRKLQKIADRLVQDPEIQKLVKDHTFLDKNNKITATQNIKGIQNILKNKLKPDEMQYLKYGWGPRLRKAMKLGEGYMSQEQLEKHEDKLDDLKTFLDANVGREFVYDFNKFPKTVFGVPINESLLNEGGAGGHMAHPFNIEWVKTGTDLVKAFQMSIEYLKNGPASVKIDGVNASIRFVELDGKKQFVMDRGSNKPLDVKGITKAELTDRFGEGHGMIVVGGKVLDIFNAAIPAITPQLKKLGMWDNPNILFNIEYVAGSTNVLSYNKNFLAIHGLLEISQVTPKRRGTVEKAHSESVMQELLDNLAPSANKEGYEVLGSVPTELKGQPQLTAELNKKYTVNYGDKEETKTLTQWLQKAKVPENNIKTKEGKTIAALSKDVLIKISDGVALSDYLADPKDYQAAVDGFVIYIATMKLGDAVLDKLNSPLGPVSEHEGIVIRDERISKEPFKITGKFILGGLATSFRK